MSAQSIDSQRMPYARLWMLLSFASLLFAITIASAQPAPSFDCAKAADGAEQAICKDGKLAEIDAAIARAYAAALAKLKGSAAKVLQEDQRSFLAIRDAAYGRPDDNLHDRLQDRLTFLEGVSKASPAAKDFTGTWENSFGTITIKAASGGKLSIEAQSAEPISARWVCDTTAEAAPEKGALTFTDADTPEETTATIRLHRDGPLLVVSEEVKPEAIRGYCGANGYLEGSYFRTAP